MTNRVFALEGEHSALGAEFMDWNGLKLAANYSGITVEQEHDAVRDAAGMYDLTAFRMLWLRGPDARAVLDQACTRDISKLKPNRATYTCVLTDDGGVVDDSVVFCTADDAFLYVIGTGNSGEVIEKIAKGKDVELEWDNSLQLMSLQGPKAIDILAPNASGDVAGLKFFQHTKSKLFGRDVMIARVGYSGERGYEIYASAEDAPHIWRSILEAGKQHGIQPCSFASLTPVRVEAGLLFHPFDVNEDTTPWEVGLGFTIDKSKGDFVGRDAVLAKEGKERFIARGVSCPSDKPVFEGEEGLYRDGKKVGKIISPAYSHRMKKSIAIAYLDPDVTEGATLTVGNDAGAQKVAVEDLPFYDKKKERLRA
ncbi:aminomethyltransferase family protein [Roseovarius sp. Pro17]|uniref:aminomethyltransferase family protein n=1 Tax=Roseovarius sp. Pro17 TaxID=3108175 RepID=UPI002D771E83|nr:aminomethyltransferase family protein [Roseovarius sp. Pro17]